MISITARRPLSSLVLTLCISAAVTAQTTIHVPGDQPGIQQGIAAASGGDTVLVAPGTYVESIDFLGKAITVVSSGGPGVTTIRGRSGSTVVFQSLEGNDSVLEGFRIEGGAPGVDRGVSAGFGASPTLRDCHLVGNTTTGSGGGAQFLWGGVVERCLFRGNSAAGDGGGLACSQQPTTITDCTFVDNVAGGDGGGLALSTDCDVSDCVFEGNDATGDGGGMWTAIANFQFDVTGCSFRSNTASQGGGLFVERFDSGLIHGATDIRDSVFLDNHATLHGGGAWLSGTDTGVGGSQLEMSRCSFGENTAGANGGALGLDASPGKATLDRLTFAGNGAGSLGDAIWSTSTLASFMDNSIVWDHTGAFAGSGFNVRQSDVQGGVVGANDAGGNIDADPLFLDAVNRAYGLLPGSPCIGAGAGGQDMGAFDAGPWYDHGRALHGATGRPRLQGTGPMTPASNGNLVLTGARPSGVTNLVLGASYLGAPFKQGILIPATTFIIFGIPLDANGDVTVAFNTGTGLPSGLSVFMQYWTADAATPAGFSASNGLSATGP